ncbi:hypothetical protein FRC10_004309 [Ceratobasidium sp. 414]|nr:hypothetical protein FRC10_004309 [Ceratobasidium sp. 414]
MYFSGRGSRLKYYNVALRYCRDIKLLDGSWTLYARIPQITGDPVMPQGYDALVKSLDAAQWVDATIRLDDKFGNNDGKLVWVGKLDDTAPKPTLDGTRLTAQLRNIKGDWSTSSVDLDEHLDVINGVIVYREAYRTGEDAYIRIDSVNIQPLYPVLDEFGQCPGFEFPLTLWLPGMTSANPCTIDMNGGTKISTQITLKQDNVTVIDSASDLPCTFEVTATSPATLLTHTIQNSLPGFPVSLPTGIPWGCKRDHSWVFNYVVGPEKESCSLLLKHPIEIYGVTPHTDDDKTKPPHYYGIPRAALDFYLIHAKKVFPEPINTLKDYVRSIVYASHWCSGFVYDTFRGAASFAQWQGDNWSFNVRLWAHLLRPTTKDNQPVPDTSHCVNCYDQAAVVWTGVTLALETGSVPKLIWRFASPFGFINSTHLVGWPGETNNPFFKQISDAQNIPKTDGRFTWRKSFGNHAFLEFDEGVLDATCGPWVGDKSLDEYLKGSIDYETGYRNPLAEAAIGAREELTKIIDRVTTNADLFTANSNDKERCEEAVARLQTAITTPEHWERHFRKHHSFTHQRSR